MQDLDRLMKDFPQLEPVKASVRKAFEQMRRCYQAGGKVLLCGNGGSAADCEHIAGELMKEFQIRRPISQEFAEKLRKFGANDAMLKNLVGALPAVSLTSHVAFTTAYCNDNDAEYVFAQQLYALGEEGDILFAITTSGNSSNIMSAAIVAKAMGIKVIALTGREGGEVKTYADVLINVPAQETACVQELHLPIYHALCGMLEEFFWGKEFI